MRGRGSRRGAGREARRGVAQAPADHRIDLYQTHKDDPATPSRKPRGPRKAGEGRQGARHRAPVHDSAPARSRSPRASAWACPLRDAQPSQPVRPRDSSATTSPSPSRWHRRDSLLRPRARLPLRQVPQAGGHRGRRAGRAQEYFEGDRGMRILAALDAGRSAWDPPRPVSLAWIMAQPRSRRRSWRTSVAQLDEIAGARASHSMPRRGELDRASR